MVTIRKLISNVASGQSTLQLRYVLTGLNNFYESIKNAIQITYAKNELDGSLIYFKVPSEKTPGLNYDVVVWLNTTDKMGLETEVKVYSNSPAFAYNFVYVLNAEKGLLFEDDYPKEFITLAPKVRNPLGTTAFDKHVYSCLKLLGSKRTTLASLIKDYDNKLEPTISSFTDKQNEIAKLKKPSRAR